MRRYVLILYIITLSFLMSSCTVVNNTAQSELTAKEWCFENPEAIYGELKFIRDEGKATFSVTDNEGKTIVIEGIYSVDDETLVIVSSDSGISHVFDYEVYEDRVYLIYDNSKITVNYDDYMLDMSLKGEFVRIVKASCELDEDMKAEVIRMGIQALAGEMED